MIGLLDGDIVVFRCGFAAERNVWYLAWNPIYETAPDGTKDLDNPEWKDIKAFEYKKEAKEHLDKVLPGQYSRVEGQDYMLWPEKDLEPLSHALQGVKTLVGKVCEACDLNPDFDLKVCFSDSRNFRHDIATTRPYKGNRKVEHRPTYEKEIKKYMRETYDCVVGDNEEADDLMGILQTKHGPEDSIIISLDKDLDQVPGLKYNWMHDARYNVTPEQAMYNFHLQLMSGDATDNIPGLPGIGPGKAAKALHGKETEYEQLEEVVNMYKIHSGKEDWKQYLLEQGQLLWIRRQPGEFWNLPVGFDPDATAWGDMELTLEAE